MSMNLTADAAASPRTHSADELKAAGRRLIAWGCLMMAVGAGGAFGMGMLG